MRVEHSTTSISWIPSEAVTGLVYRVPFDMGVSHYDPPPPEALPDLDDLVSADRLRFANRLAVWAEVEDGVITDAGHSGAGRIGSTTLRLAGQAVTFAAVQLPDRRSVERIDDTTVRFMQTSGGRTGVPAPRRVSRPPYVQYHAPIAWTTLSITLRADGSADSALEGASPFPRHWVYDDRGQLVTKTAVVDYRTWSATAFGRRTPWGDEDSPALVAEVESALERELSARIMSAGRRPQVRRLPAGAVLTEQGQPGDDLYLLLDGVLQVEVDGEPLASLGPGAVVGERALLEGGRRTSTLRAVTPCTVAVAARDAVDDHALRAVAGQHRREEGRT